MMRANVAAAAVGLLSVQAAMAAFFVTRGDPGTDAAWTSFPLDDSWIHLIYARSLAQLDGFAYNPGQAEAGFSSPLWALLLAPAFWLAPLWGGGVVAAVKLLGVALAGGCSIAAALLASSLSGSRRAGLLAGLLVALDPGVAFGAVSGMEVPLASAGPLVAAACLARDRPRSAGLAVALSALSRPEHGLLVFAAAPPLFTLLLDRRAAPRVWLAVAAPAVLAGAAWIAYCLAVTGQPLPSTFYAKSPGVLWWPQVERNLRVVAGILGELPWLYGGAGLALVTLGMARLLALARRHPSSGLRGAAALTLIYPWLFALGILVTHRLGPPEYFYWSRYLHPVLPGVLIAWALGAFSLVRLSASAARESAGLSPTAGRVRAVLGAVLCLPAALAWPGAMGEAARRYAWNCQNMREVQVEIGHWLSEHTGPQQVIASIDAGAIGFYDGRTTVDLIGLNSHRLLHGDRDEALARADARFAVGIPGVFPDDEWLAAWGAVERFRATSPHYTVAPDPRQGTLAVWELTAPPPRTPAPG